MPQVRRMMVGDPKVMRTGGLKERIIAESLIDIGLNEW